MAAFTLTIPDLRLGEFDLGGVLLTSVSSYTDRDILVVRDATQLSGSVTYFNLGGDGDMAKAPRLMKKKQEQFGSVETCARDFKATASMRGIGWVIMYQDIESGLIFNQWINEHDAGHPAGCNPILVLDVFEHAFMVDYGLKRADYIASFFRNVNWKAAEARLS